MVGAASVGLSPSFRAFRGRRSPDQRIDRLSEHPAVHGDVMPRPYLERIVLDPSRCTNPAQQPQLDCTGSTDQHVFVSPDGTEVIFASNRAAGGTSNFQLYTMPFSTDGTASGTPVDVSQDFPTGASDDYPSWAPASSGNQNTVIFQRTLAGGQPELYTEN